MKKVTIEITPFSYKTTVQLGDEKATLNRKQITTDVTYNIEANEEDIEFIPDPLYFILDDSRSTQDSIMQVLQSSDF